MNPDDILAALPRATPSHRHRWDVPPSPSMREDDDYRMGCRCGRRQDAAATKKGRSSRRMGNDFERDVTTMLSSVFPDVKRVGQYGGPDDVAGRLLYVQCKKVAGMYPRKADALLSDAERHANADQYPVVAMAHPGHGHHKLVVMDLSDFTNLLRQVIGEAKEER